MILRIPQVTAEGYVEKTIAKIKETVGEGKVLLALSGGVDSSVCAALLAKAIGKGLTCVFVDHGFMRKNEANEIKSAFKDFDFNLIALDAEARFLAKTNGVTEPEKKRKIIGEEFIRVFEEEARKIGAVDFLAQGTIYPDVTESDDKIKSHHNVGGLPENINFREIIEPVRELYKNEVRQVGKVLGLPDYLTQRQPFPGPGLAVRCIGELTKAKLDILREADYIFREEVEKAGISGDVSQYFAALTDMKAVGIKSGKRTYGYVVVLRAVKTVDFTTAKIVQIPYEVLERVSFRLTEEVNEVSRVMYDVTDKPNGTIELE